MSRTVVSPGEVALNDTAHALKSTKISIVNTGSTAVSYKLSHLPAAAALTFSDVRTMIWVYESPFVTAS